MDWPKCSKRTNLKCVYDENEEDRTREKQLSASVLFDLMVQRTMCVRQIPFNKIWPCCFLCLCVFVSIFFFDARLFCTHLTEQCRLNFSSLLWYYPNRPCIKYFKEPHFGCIRFVHPRNHTNE